MGGDRRCSPPPKQKTEKRHHLFEWDVAHSGAAQRCGFKQRDAEQHDGDWARRLPGGRERAFLPLFLLLLVLVFHSSSDHLARRP